MNVLEKAEKCFELAVNLSETYKQGNIFQKVEIIKMLCFELFIDHQKCLHIAERELYKGIKNLGNTVWLG